MRAAGVEVADTKSSPVDVVTEADQACEALIRDRLLGARPDDGFVGEEGDDVHGDLGVAWVVDPIDGTVNYLYGIPQYAVSIAAARGDEVVAGVVHSPALGLEYAAVRGGGATCDGVPARVRADPAARPAPGRHRLRLRDGDARERQAAAVARMLPQVRDIRRQGSCALDLCSVAAGQAGRLRRGGPARLGLRRRRTGRGGGRRHASRSGPRPPAGPRGVRPGGRMARFLALSSVPAGSSATSLRDLSGIHPQT